MVWLGALALWGLSAATAGAVPLEVGSSGVVRADGDCLRMRAAPGLAGAVLTCLPEGTTVVVVSAPAAADGLEWQQVRAGGTSGWVANLYLQPAPPAAPPPAAAPPVPSSAAPLPKPAEGGLTLGMAGTSDPAALVAAQPFPVESVSLLEVATQRWLTFIPGAPAVVNTLSSSVLRPDSVVTVKRQGLATPGAPPAPAAPRPTEGSGNALPAPPTGGLTQGVSATNDPARLAAAQPFPVESISLLDVGSQRWLVFIPGAPAIASTLSSGHLAVGSIVTVKAAAGAAPPPPTASPPAAAGGTPPSGYQPGPPSSQGDVPGPAGNEAAETAATRTVRLTYYYCQPGTIPASIGDGGGFCGRMANGDVVYRGAASCAAELLGERFRVRGDPDGLVYTCADVGGGVDVGHRDIWFPDSDSAYRWSVAVGPTAVIERLAS